MRRLISRLQHLSRPKRNLIANLFGNGWSAVFQLLLVPLYIRLLGTEVYGLYAVYFTLQGLVQVLDFGFSTTINRELARYAVQPGQEPEARNLVHTMEVIYIGIGVVIGAGIALLAPLLSTDWIRANTLSSSTVTEAVTLMGLLVALQWPITFYQNGLIGLQRQVRLTALQVTMSTLRGGGALLMLWLFSPTIYTLLIWQCAVSILHTLFIAGLLWRSLAQAGHTPEFRLSYVQGIRTFAAGLSASSVVGILLTQSSSVLMVRLLDLKTFGYYSLASFLASSMVLLITPIFNTIFPRFAALVASKDEMTLRRFYHFCAQILSAIILPIGCTLIFFAPELILVWQRNAELVPFVAPIAMVLVLNAMLGGVQYIPYALQLAYGWTAIGFQINLGLTILQIPLLLVLVNRFGVMGAASTAVALTLLSFILNATLTHRRYLQGESATWVWQDILLPLAVALLTIGVARLILPVNTALLPQLFYIGFSLVIGVVGVIVVASQIREWLWVRLRTRLVHLKP